MRFFRKPAGWGPARALSSARPVLEELETRLAPYAATGNAWPEPQLITISFVPDGTLMTSGANGNVYSDLFAKFNARWPTQTWQDAIISAAQTWAQYANINFSVAADNGTPSGQGSYQQGDPGMGDVRVGGYNIGSNYLGMTYMPPPANNYSAAGDMTLNDTQPFNIGRTYDLQSVALHEFGHALGLDHSTYGTVMYAAYSGVKKGLSADDVAGAQAVYGARQPDANNLITPNNSFATATDLSSPLAAYPSVGLAGNDLTAVGATEYYTFTAPANTPANFTVYVQSAGLSLLRPQVTVFAADQATVLGFASGAGSYNGANLAVPVSGVTAGTQYYVAVTGADGTAFATGNYNLTVTLGGGTMPTVVSPVTSLANGTVLSAGGGLAFRTRPPDFLEIDPNFTDGSDAGQAASAAPDSVVGFIAQTYQGLLGRPVDAQGLSAFTALYVQAEANALQMILSNPQFGPLMQMLLQQPGGAQAAQDLLSCFGELAVVQGVQALAAFDAGSSDGTAALDQLMADAVSPQAGGPPRPRLDEARC
jgi:hypothetical protein